ncbi:polysaccharide deacetylase family protein [Anaerolineales bacterium HSG24]|nr:polysaccharide deacetylase family protein [Anaerolineales bacterium HSG24]
MNNRQYSPLTRNALSYTWQQLAQRVGIDFSKKDTTGFEPLNIKVYYSHLDNVKTNVPSIIVVPTTDIVWHDLLNCSSNSLTWVSTNQVVPSGIKLPFDDKTPVLLWGKGYTENHKPFVELRDDKTVVFYADIIATIFFMLSRWEETVVGIRDEHERFPATASVAYKQGFLDRPIVDEYALILREWIRVLLPTWTPKSHQFTVKLSHDIDHLARFSSIKAGFRNLAGDIIKRRNISQTRQTVVDLWWQQFNLALTPQMQGIKKLAEFSEQNGMQSTFYFMATDPSPYDKGYDLTSSVIRYCIKELLKNGHEIGFHPGYYTFNNPEQLAKEKSRLNIALRKTQYGGRQHYLRFQVPNTWRHWEQIGLSYDSTMGYAEYEGFRCGTCHPFQPFDVIKNRILNVTEIPLIVMDVTLKQYRHLSPQEGYLRIITLAQRCKNVGGTFTLLWHNTSFDDNWKPWINMYKLVLPYLAIL